MSVMKRMYFEEMDRNARQEEAVSEMIAREDDVGFKESRFVNLELTEVLEDLKQQFKNGEK